MRFSKQFCIRPISDWLELAFGSLNMRFLCQPRRRISVLQVMDFGYPQFTEAKILSEFIKTDAYKMEVSPYPSPGSQRCSH